MRRSTRQTTHDEDDATLARRAAAGDDEAFAQLYRRHAPCALRVAYAVSGNRDDAADAASEAFARVLQALAAGRLSEGSSFRPYLLAAARHIALDGCRRTRRGPALARISAPTATPAELVIDGEDAALIATAFRALPERWRSVLWLTEVEGVSVREAADVLGVSPNGVAQLAVRARRGLRQRFLQAHLLGTPVEPDCEASVRQLGAYVAGALAPRDTAKVDQHLAACVSCSARCDQLTDVGSSLRHALVPLALVEPAHQGWKLLERFRAVRSAVTAPVSVAPAASPLAAACLTLFVAGTSLLGAHVTQPRSRQVATQTGVATPVGGADGAAAAAAAGASGSSPALPERGVKRRFEPARAAGSGAAAAEPLVVPPDVLAVLPADLTALLPVDLNGVLPPEIAAQLPADLAALTELAARVPADVVQSLLARPSGGTDGEAVDPAVEAGRALVAELRAVLTPATGSSTAPDRARRGNMAF